MSDTPNPYAPSSPTSTVAPNDYVPTPGDTKIFSQILVVSILQIIVGALEGFMCLILLMYAFLFPTLMTVAAGQGGGGAKPPPPEVLTGITIYFGVAGSITLLSAILRLYSGISSIWFRGRTMLIASLFVGLLTSASCYCGLTAVPLAIYGAIIMFHPVTKRVFQLRQDGMTPPEIRARMGR